MYNERKETFSVKDIIIQILCILLFVFLLLWLFPTKSFIKNNMDGVSEELENQVVDTVFNYNIQMMKEAALAYYTTPKLPSKVGDTDIMTLRTMLNEKLLTSFLDSDNKQCDLDNSYVQITKASDEFTLKVNLVCPSSKSDYILVHLGCYDYCKGNICEKKTVAKKTTPQTKPTENKPKEEPKKEEQKPTVIAVTKSYEYSKTTKGTCTWSGWSNWTTTPIAKSDNVNVETTVSYSGGSTYTSYTYEDLKVTTSEKTQTPICNNSNASLTDNNAKCMVVNSDVLVKAPTCGSNYTLSNGTCVKNTPNNSKLITTTTPSTSTWSTPKRVVYSSAQTSTSTTKYDYVSVSYGVGSCSGCSYSINYIYDVSTLKTTKGKTTYSCESGYMLSGNQCYYTKSPSYTYSCSNSNYTYVEGVGCTYKFNSVCKEGVKNSDGTKCVIKSTTTECENGTYDSSVGKCKVPYTYTTGGSSTTYYRSQTKSCTKDTVDYKYSNIDSDSTLLNLGYKLTGKVINK